MRSTTSELNWSGTVTYTAERVVRPSSIDEAAQIVADADRVHGLGTRHSFNDVADTAGTLLDLTGIPTDLVVDAEHRTVTLGAGTRYGDVAADIDRAGFALHNTGSLPHISIGGAVATGTHGSGTTLGSLATAVRAFEVLGPDGSARTIDRTDPAFDGAVLHLGLLGIVTRVTLDVEPSYRMRQDVYGAIPWDSFTANVAEVHATAYSVCAYTVFGDAITEVLVKSRVPEGAEDVPVPETLAGAHRLPGTPGDDHRTARDGSVGPWWDRLPHFPIGSVPSHGSEVQSEHFVPLRHAAAALDALRGLADRIQPHLHVCELRTMAADDLWLSPTQGEDVLCIAFTWKKHPTEVAALLPDLEARLAAFDGRPHWGKMSSLDHAAIAGLYPRLAEFRDLVARADPERTFASAFGERVLGT
ncbi:FAD-binding protein [Curtobacterium flaccumfaciens pv. flaccumfaciens]|uniref:D-arabinono-1,4-lactone oxidase n=1 Tax=Curtobacterium flaccumfaciens TaxID=2035 RepID=UPI00217D11B2|nr:D-arabinono-1,4-lactone oxidase [Curtobacterium flaccumfaciens]MCS6568469.1 FAD-binding protein [Curtobacterium flaccumfaciens pv. flaccumfaciens]MCS6586663.1 FAD-binding protein [Curtobacterium flaccumfaciens pv. flaccumfaciens]